MRENYNIFVKERKMPRPLYRFTSSLSYPSVLFLVLFVTACGGGGGSAVIAPPVVVEPPAPPADTTPPTITLSGDAEMRVEQGTEFTDPGVSANDDIDGEVTVSVSGIVDTATAGVYRLTYTATDSAGNEASSERVVTVSDTRAPSVTLNGSGSITLEADSAYAEQAA